VDTDSFEEFDMFIEHTSHDFGMEKKKFAGDGVVTGCGTIDERIVFIFAQDFYGNWWFSFQNPCRENL